MGTRDRFRNGCSLLLVVALAMSLIVLVRCESEDLPECAPQAECGDNVSSQCRSDSRGDYLEVACINGYECKYYCVDYCWGSGRDWLLGRVGQSFRFSGPMPVSGQAGVSN